MAAPRLHHRGGRSLSGKPEIKPTSWNIASDQNGPRIEDVGANLTSLPVTCLRTIITRVVSGGCFAARRPAAEAASSVDLMMRPPPWRKSTTLLGWETYATLNREVLTAGTSTAPMGRWDTYAQLCSPSVALGCWSRLAARATASGRFS